MTSEVAQQDLNMNNHVISYAPNRMNSQVAINKEYIDQNIILVSGPADNVMMNNFKLTDLHEPTDSKDTVTNNHVYQTCPTFLVLQASFT